MISGIYSIINIINNKVYVGSAQWIEQRWSTHKAELSRNQHYNSYLQRSWNKYGPHAFEFSVLETCSKDLLSEREQFWMDHFQVCDPSRGFNLQPNARATRGFKHEPETIEKMKLAAQRRCDLPGHRQMLSERAKRQWAEGRIHPGEVTPERRAKLSASATAQHARRKQQNA